MSVEAIAWVLRDAPDVPPQLVSVLIGLANHASPDGRNAYPSQATLARYARKNERTIRRELARLEVLGLIRRGDQRIVDHLPKDRRPVVYDLAMDLDGGAHTPGGAHRTGGSPASARPVDKPPNDDLDGGAWETERGGVGDRTGGAPTPAKPSFEPYRTVSQSAQVREATRWLVARYGLTDTEAIRVITEVHKRAAGPVKHLVPYLERMADQGHLADIVGPIQLATTPPPPPEPRPPIQLPMLQAVPDPPPAADVPPAAHTAAQLRAQMGWRKTAP